MKDESIEQVPLLPEGKGGWWRGYKNRRTRLINEIKAISGVGEDLLGPADNNTCINQVKEREKMAKKQGKTE